MTAVTGFPPWIIWIPLHAWCPPYLILWLTPKKLPAFCLIHCPPVLFLPVQGRGSPIEVSSSGFVFSVPFYMSGTGTVSVRLSIDESQLFSVKYMKPTFFHWRLPFGCRCQLAWLPSSSDYTLLETKLPLWSVKFYSLLWEVFLILPSLLPPLLLFSQLPNMSLRKKKLWVDFFLPSDAGKPKLRNTHTCKHNVGTKHCFVCLMSYFLSNFDLFLLPPCHYLRKSLGCSSTNTQILQPFPIIW